MKWGYTKTKKRDGS